MDKNPQIPATKKQHSTEVHLRYGKEPLQLTMYLPRTSNG